eukprot:438992-Rhodomonas_salina.1
MASNLRRKKNKVAADFAQALDESTNAVRRKSHELEMERNNDTANAERVRSLENELREAKKAYERTLNNMVTYANELHTQLNVSKKELKLTQERMAHLGMELDASRQHTGVAVAAADKKTEQIDMLEMDMEEIRGRNLDLARKLKAQKEIHEKQEKGLFVQTN